MASKGKKGENEQPAPIIIKRIKKVSGGHHGGAWKVAYADFVTAMMAFFLLLWLLNVTTAEEKNAISNYFDPSHPLVSNSESGAGSIMGGMTMTVEGAMVSTVQPIVQPDVPDTTTRGARQGQTDGEDTDVQNVRDLETQKIMEAMRKKEDERFKKAADDLKAEIAKSADLKEMQKNLMIDITPEGLRIQIVDDKGRSMFPIGSAQMYPFMRELLLKVSGVIKPLPNQVSVRGHTDSNKYKDPTRYDNWNLSADRAQSSRRVLVEGGLPETRVENVMGRADREHLDVKNPQDEKNRRISIVLIREKIDPKTIAKNAAKDQPKKAGITIVDDTKPAAQQVQQQAQGAQQGSGQDQHGQTQGQGKPAGITGSGDAHTVDAPSMPLPVARDKRITSVIKRQPQVMYFGEEPAKKTEELYKGPVQDPITKTQPRDETQSLNPDTFKSERKKEPAANKKELVFGDAPVMTAPTMPSAPAALPPENGSVPPATTTPEGEAAPAPTPQPKVDGDKKVLEF